MTLACRRRWLILALLLSGGLAAAQSRDDPPPDAEPLSLFFTPSEMTALRRVLSPSAEPTMAAAPAPVEVPVVATRPNIHISALVDFGDGQWVVWANGRRVTPTSQPDAFKVLAVAEDHVDLEISGDQPTRVRLRANQTWRAAQGDIVEGLAR